MKRIPFFYGYTLIIPCVLLSLLTLPEPVLGELPLERGLGQRAEREELTTIADVDMGRIDGVQVGSEDRAKCKELATEH